MIPIQSWYAVGKRRRKAGSQTLGPLWTPRKLVVQLGVPCPPEQPGTLGHRRNDQVSQNPPDPPRECQVRGARGVHSDTVSSLYQYSGRVLQILVVGALDCGNVPLAKSQEREDSGRAIGKHQEHERIEYAKNSLEGMMFHCLGLADALLVYQLPSLGGRPPE